MMMTLNYEFEVSEEVGLATGTASVAQSHSICSCRNLDQRILKQRPIKRTRLCEHVSVQAHSM
jgi:hypothetical protein